MTPTAADLDRELIRSILTVLPGFGRLAAAVGREHGTVTPQAGKLLFVLRGGPVRSSELAERCLLARPSVSELTDGLVSAGYVRRDEVPDDRRGVVLALTPAGRRAVERFEERLGQALQSVLARLEPAARERVRAAFRDLEQALREAPDVS